MINHTAKNEGIRPRDHLRGVPVQRLVGDARTVIAAAVKADVDGIAQWPHRASVARPTCHRDTALLADESVESPQ